jgi:hypothetical protein
MPSEGLIPLILIFFSNLIFFTRKPIILVSIALFAVGSALAGASQNMVCRHIHLEKSI